MGELTVFLYSVFRSMYCKVLCFSYKASCDSGCQWRFPLGGTQKATLSRGQICVCSQMLQLLGITSNPLSQLSS